MSDNNDLSFDTDDASGGSDDKTIISGSSFSTGGSDDPYDISPAAGAPDPAYSVDDNDLIAAAPTPASDDLIGETPQLASPPHGEPSFAPPGGPVDMPPASGGGMNKTYIIIAVVVALLLCCCCLGLVGALLVVSEGEVNISALPQVWAALLV